LPLPLPREIVDLISVDVEHDLAAASVVIPDHNLRTFPILNL
jgi:hypothetical protein